MVQKHTKVPLVILTEEAVSENQTSEVNAPQRHLEAVGVLSPHGGLWTQ